VDLPAKNLNHLQTGMDSSPKPTSPNTGEEKEKPDDNSGNQQPEFDAPLDTIAGILKNYADSPVAKTFAALSTNSRSISKSEEEREDKGNVAFLKKLVVENARKVQAELSKKEEQERMKLADLINKRDAPLSEVKETRQEFERYAKQLSFWRYEVLKNMTEMIRPC